MRLCIITDDKMISKDNEAYVGVDISCIPSTIHALQWYETSGEIEYKSTGPYSKPANEQITILPDWVDTALAIWEEAKAQKQPRAEGVQTL